MRTARTTVLMSPEEKAALEKRAASRGVSSGEYIRLAVDNFEKVSDELKGFIEEEDSLDKAWEALGRDKDPKPPEPKAPDAK